jgi:hypothetical protein
MQQRHRNVPELRIRWSEHEARKPYARPFGVMFMDDAGATLGSVALSGSHLLYYRQFQAAVLALTGELFNDVACAHAADAQRAWLDRITPLLPSISAFNVSPVSSFDEHAGRVFLFAVSTDGVERCRIDAPSLLEYQEFQALLAHQTGALYRHRSLEAIEESNARQAAWIALFTQCLARPGAEDAMSASWPWR